MKKYLLTIISSLILLAGKAQVMPTIADIYSYDIGDEFHYRRPLIPDNIARVLITGKYFSATSDTVFYVTQNDNYTTTLSGGTPPAVTVNVSSYVDTICYTDLAMPIDSVLNYVINDSCDTWHDSLYASSDYCGAQVFENNTCIDCCFEGDQYRHMYGVGLGELYYYHLNPGNMFQEQYVQSFYRKAASGDSCGNANRTYYAGLKQATTGKKITFYPNPSSGKLHISNVKNETTIELYDMYGKLLLKDHINADASLDVSAFGNGVYLLITNDGTKVSSEKLAIEKN